MGRESGKDGGIQPNGQEIQPKLPLILPKPPLPQKEETSPKRGRFSWLKWPKFGGSPKEKPPKETSQEILAKTELPNLGPVNLEDISIYRLPIDLLAVKRLGLLINNIKDTPLDKFEFDQYEPHESVYGGIVPVASIFAHQFYPEIPEMLLTDAEIEPMRPHLGKAASLVGRFWSGGEFRLRRFMEKRAESMVREAADNIAHRAVKPLLLLGEVPNPRASFVKEVADVYRDITEIEMQNIGWIDNYWVPKPIEVQVYEFMQLLPNIRDSWAITEWRGRNIGRETHPLLARIMEGLRLPNEEMEAEFWYSSVAGAEMMSGIKQFLETSGERNLPEAPAPTPAIDLENPDTWTLDPNTIIRTWGEWKYADKIKRVKDHLPDALTQARDILPENGPELRDAVRDLAVKVLILSKQGATNAEIAAALFAKPNSQVQPRS